MYSRDPSKLYCHLDHNSHFSNLLVIIIKSMASELAMVRGCQRTDHGSFGKFCLEIMYNSLNGCWLLLACLCFIQGV